MKVAVVGAGLSGLNAGRILSEYCKVAVFEPHSLGGLAGSFCTGEYCIEKFYHHFFRSDDYLLSLLKTLKLSGKTVWKTARIGQEFNGNLYSLSTPVEILKFPGLSILDKIRLAIFTLKAKKIEYEKYDETGVIEGLKRDVGERLYDNFFLPLLKAKFGENYREVSYAWLLARVSIRSNRKLFGEELGYLRGGFHQLVERLSENLEIRKEKARIEKSGKWTVNGEKFDSIVFTAPIPELGSLGEKLGIKPVRYQSSICLLISMDSPFTENLYWVNYPNEPFGATIEHTNFMPLEDYGEHLMYVAGYTIPENLSKLQDEQLFRLWLSSLKKYGLEERNIRWWRVFKAKYSGAVYVKGFRKLITPYRLADGLYYAGLTSKDNYPERSMNGSLLAGKNAAELVIKDHLS